MAKPKSVEKKEEAVAAAPTVEIQQEYKSALTPIIQAKQEYEFEEQRAADRRKLKGVFRDLEVKGGVLKFAFKKWKGDDICFYELHDGQEYELPVAVVKHLNNLCYHEDSYSKDLISADGRPMKNPNSKKITRFSFQSSEYN